MGEHLRVLRSLSRALSGHRLVVISVVAALGIGVVGPGVLAQLSDTVRVDGNELSSNALVQGGDLVIGLGIDSVCPASVEYGPGPVPGVEMAFDVNAPELGWSTSAEVCIRNDGDVSLDLTAAVVVTSDVEIGACEPSEVTAGDTSCADGAAGEMAQSATVTRRSPCGPTGEIVTPLTDEESLIEMGTIEPGQVCSLSVFVEMTGPVALWQTDRATYDIVITGQVPS